MTRVFNKNVFSSLKFGALTSDDVTITNSSSQVTNNEEDLTIICDVKFNVFGDYYVFAIPATVGANRVYIYAQVNNTIGVNLGASSMGTSATNLTPGNWYQLALLIDRTNSRARFLVNGTETKAWTAVTLGTGAADITFGNVGSSAVKSLIGNALNYRMWNRILSDTEIQNLHFKEIVPRNSLIGEWLLGEGAGTIAYDSSGRGNNGTISGASWSSDTPSKARLNINNNMVKNGNLSYMPVVNTPSTGSARWYDGTLAGSTTNDVFSWYTITGTGTTTYLIDFGVKSPTGSPSLKIDCDATGRGRFSTAPFETTTTQELIRQYGIKVLPNTTYTLTFYIKTISTINARIDVIPFNLLGAALTLSSSTTISGTNDWTQQSLTFTTATNAYYVILRPILVTAGNAQTVWFSDISVLPTVPVRRQVDADFSISASGQATSPNPSIDTVTSNAGTVMGWFKVSSYNGQTLLGFYDSIGTSDAWRIAIETATGYPFVWSVNTSASGTAVIKPSMPVPLNQWFHMAAVQTIANGDVTAKIYINGSLWGTGVRVGSDVRSNARFVINSTALQRYSKIVAYERELTQTEVIAHYQKDITPTGSKIKYDVNEGAGDILYDSSGFGSSGTLGTLVWTMDSPTGMRKQVNQNLVRNGSLTKIPVVNAVTTTGSGYMIGATAASSTNNIFNWTSIVDVSPMELSFDVVERSPLGSPSLKVNCTTTLARGRITTGSGTFGTASSMSPFNLKSSPILLRPGVSYTITFYMKTTNATASTGINLHQYDGAGTRTSNTGVGTTSGTTPWTKYTTTFTADTGAQYGVLSCGVNNAGNVQIVWFADIVLTPTTATSRTDA